MTANRMKETGCIVHAMLDEQKRNMNNPSSNTNRLIAEDLSKLQKQNKGADGNAQTDGVDGHDQAQEHDPCEPGDGLKEDKSIPQICPTVKEGLARERRASTSSEGSFYLANESMQHSRNGSTESTKAKPSLTSIAESQTDPDGKTRPGPRAINTKDEKSSRLLTKAQLSDMAWGVRELSQRLGSMKLHLRVRTVFILTKAHDNSLLSKTREVAEWLLHKDRDVKYVVYVEKKLQSNPKFDAQRICADCGPDGCKRLKYWTEEMCRERPQTFDFVVTLGGDGTVLYASWLFQKVVPPVLSFALGSLGFLTQYDFSQFRETLTESFRDGVRVSLRLRFEGTVMRAVRNKRIRRRTADIEEKPDLDGHPLPMDTSNGVPEEEAYDSQDDERDLVEELLEDEEEDAPTHIPTTTFSILNDIIIDRGPSPTLSTLEIFTSSGSGSGSNSGTTTHLTTLLGDGLCIATPTGSTAYNLAASGPLSHPSNPVMLLTAICAHSLSFRPLVLPDSIVLRVGVPFDARQGAWAAFDGRERVRLGRGDYVSIRAGRWPFSGVEGEGMWEGGLKGGLGWNCRGGGKQKKFDK